MAFTATEQQLLLISKRVDRLEQAVAADVAQVKSLRLQRDDALRTVEQLTEQLQNARRVAEEVTTAHDEATVQLKHSASEYSKAQLLRKRYKNSVDELKGHCRSVIALTGAAEQSQLVVTDDVTVNLPARNKQFVVDAVCPVDEGAEVFLTGPGFSIESLVQDVLNGLNSTVLVVGPPNAGTSAFVFGRDRASWPSLMRKSSSVAAPARSRSTASNGNNGAGAQNAGSSAPGLVHWFFHNLFDRLEALQVTHFNMRLSVAELGPSNAVCDLLGEFHPTINVMGAATQGGEVRLLPFDSAAAAMDLINGALQRIAPRSRSHVVVSSVIENFNSSGHFRRATVTFVDFQGASLGTEAAGAGPAMNSASSHDLSSSRPDAVWAQRSLVTFCDAVAVAAQEKQLQHSPLSRSPLVQMLGEGLQGNCKCTLICNLPVPRCSLDALLHFLLLAYQFKLVVNQPVPYDIPPELQRLQAEAEADLDY